ncbi:hypothetical protein EON65_08585 [archaeon]|nr:MAG: hypothetical protein EON65_08585 [archaeon]
MKRRQTLSSGYKLISLPFWQYKMDMTRDQKLKVMREAIVKATGTK